MKFIFKLLQQFCDFVQKFCIQVGCTLLVLYCLWPSRFASHYEYIASEQIFDSLHQKTTRNVSLSQQMECDYSDIIMDNTYMYKKSYQSEIFDSTEIKLGGIYHPGSVLIFALALLSLSSANRLVIVMKQNLELSTLHICHTITYIKPFHLYAFQSGVNHCLVRQ